MARQLNYEGGVSPPGDRREWRDGLIGSRRAVARSRPPRDKPETSPYFGHPVEEWPAITGELLRHHPLHPDDVVAIVHRAWEAIFRSTLGDGFYIGRDIFPAPQVLGFFLHELIGLECETVFPREWRNGRAAFDKDIVYIPDDSKSVEIKTSSDPNRIFANRSYGQEDAGKGKKAKSGYYIAVNFDPWPARAIEPGEQVIPALRRVRFGWLDHTDWLAQKAETGQQSSLPAVVENNQLLTFFAQD